MIDMARLTRFPDPAYRMVQFSSFDRRSQLPGGPEWFANSDGFGGEPIPNFEKVLKEPDENGIGEYLIAEVVGPGNFGVGDVNAPHMADMVDFCHEGRNYIAALDLIPLTAEWGPEEVDVQSTTIEGVEYYAADQVETLIRSRLAKHCRISTP